MRFEIPQFIEVEDKLFGPLTFKQFVYLAGGGAMCLVLWLSPLPKFISIVFIGPIAGLALALAFFKHNNRPFIVLLEAAFKFAIGGKLYVWQKRKKKVEEVVKENIENKNTVYVPKHDASRLKDLAWSLDVKERQRNGEVL